MTPAGRAGFISIRQRRSSSGDRAASEGGFVRITNKQDRLAARSAREINGVEMINKHDWVRDAAGDGDGHLAHAYARNDALFATDGFRVHVIKQDDAGIHLRIRDMIKETDGLGYAEVTLSQDFLRSALNGDELVTTRIYQQGTSIAHPVELYMDGAYAAIMPVSPDCAAKWRPEF